MYYKIFPVCFLLILSCKNKDTQISKETKEISKETKEISKETKEISKETKEISKETKEISKETKEISKETKEISKETKDQKILKTESQILKNSSKAIFNSQFKKVGSRSVRTKDNLTYYSELLSTKDNSIYNFLVEDNLKSLLGILFVNELNYDTLKVITLALNKFENQEKVYFNDYFPDVNRKSSQGNMSRYMLRPDDYKKSMWEYSAFSAYVNKLFSINKDKRISASFYDDLNDKLEEVAKMISEEKEEFGFSENELKMITSLFRNVESRKMVK